MAYLVYEVDGKIIKARVQQKTDTLANWLANTNIILEGEQAFVVNDLGQPINFKIGDGTKTFSELPYWIRYDQAAYIQYTDTPTEEVAYTIVGPGTYGSIEINQSQIGILSWNGLEWSSEIINIPNEAHELKPISSGSLPTITTQGINYKMYVSGGKTGATFTGPGLPSGSVTLTKYERGTLWFDKDTNEWSLLDVQELPEGEDGKTIETYNNLKSYSSGSQIFFGDEKIFEVLTTTSYGENPETSPAKFKKIFDPLDLIVGGLKKSRNLILDSMYRYGTYSVSDGSFIPQTGSARQNLAVLVKVKPNTWYGMRGGNAVNSQARMAYFTDSNTFISAVAGSTAGNFPIKFQTPANCGYVGITVAFNTNFEALNEYRKSFILAELESSSEDVPAYELGGYYYDLSDINIRLSSVESDIYILNLNNEAFEMSPNLIDNSDFVGGAFIGGAGLKITHDTASINWISCVAKVEAGLPYYLQGIQLGLIDPGFAVAVVLFGDDSDNFVGQILGTDFANPFIPPTGATKAFIRIANTLNIGNSPHDNEYVGVVQLEQNTVGTPYQPYGGRVKVSAIPNLPVSKITDFNAGVDANPTVIFNKEAVDFLLEDYDKVYKFDGTSYAALAADRVLNNPGDYLEIKFKAADDIALYQEGLQLVGKDPVSATNVLGVYSSNAIWMRESVGGTYKSWTLPEVAVGVPVTIKLEVSSDGMWELFFNGNSVGKVAKTGSFIVRNFGNAYANSNATYKFFKGSIYYTNISVSGSVTQIEDFTALSTSVNISIELIKKDSNNDLQLGYPSMFYEFSPTMYNGKEGFHIYSKLYGSNNLYVRHTLYRNYDMSELIYWDYYKLNACSVYSYNGYSMAATGVNVYIGSENEFTLLQRGKADHTGGYHGDEIYRIARFKANGVGINDLTGIIELTPCDVFEYQIVSDLHETANSATSGVPIAGHPIIAEHIKTVVIKPDKTTITNVVSFKKSIDVVRAYTGLVCLAKPFAQRGYTENGIFAEFDILDNSNALVDPNAKRVYYEGYYGGGIISSDVLNVYKPSIGNEAQLTIYKNNRDLWVTDRANDSKYYRCIGSINNNNYVTVENGEIWQMQCEIELYKK